ncbi:MAG: hypothetical protein ACOYXS_05565 [Chloroflexota bacterium]
MADIHFLLVYDLSRQVLVSQREFHDPAEAAAAYAELEAAHRADRDYEIVLVGADSIETIMQTHGHYFSRSESDGSSKYLARVS